MTDKNLLYYFVKRAGLKNQDIAKAIGVTPAGYTLKISNKSDFRQREIKTICDLIGLTAEERDRVFFAN